MLKIVCFSFLRIVMLMVGSESNCSRETEIVGIGGEKWVE